MNEMQIVVLVLYIISYVVAYILLRNSSDEELGGRDWEDIMFRLLLSSLSPVIIIISLFKYIGNNVKPPKWL